MINDINTPKIKRLVLDDIRRPIPLIAKQGTNEVKAKAKKRYSLHMSRLALEKMVRVVRSMRIGNPRLANLLRGISYYVRANKIAIIGSNKDTKKLWIRSKTDWAVLAKANGRSPFAAVKRIRLVEGFIESISDEDLKEVLISVSIAYGTPRMKFHALKLSSESKYIH